MDQPTPPSTPIAERVVVCTRCGKDRRDEDKVFNTHDGICYECWVKEHDDCDFCQGRSDER